MSKAIDLENGLPAIKTWVEGKFVEKETGKGLSTNDYTTTEKNKLAGIEAGAEVNVQADWNQTTTTADDYIKNKPSIPVATTTTPKMNGTAAVGSETKWAKGDHVHPTDTSRAANTDFTVATSAAAGTHGLVPAPAKGQQNDVLTGSGFKTILPRSNGVSIGSVNSSTFSDNIALDINGATFTGRGVVALSDSTNGTADATDGYTAATPKAVASALVAAKAYADGKADTNTTYALSKSGTTITLTGSDSSTSTVDDGKTVWYGTCSTESGTTQKVVTTTSGDFVLNDGNAVKIYFANANASNTAFMLKIDNTVAKYVDMAGTFTSEIRAGQVLDFVYDSTSGRYKALGREVATTSNFGITKLVDATNSTSTSAAATPNSVKAAYDLANGKAPTSHASSSTTYGVGTASNYGHLKLSDSTSSTSSTTSGTAATPKAVKDALDSAKSYADGIGADIPSAADATPLMDGTAAVGTSTDYAREDHVHPTDTSRAPLASPALTGTPTAPTATAGTNTTQIATTAFVKSAVDSAADPDNIEVEYDGGLTSLSDAISSLESDKVDKVEGKGLSTNDYTTADATKLAEIESGAQVNIIESVKVNGTALSVSSKAVNVPKATNSTYGAIILSDSTSSTTAAASGGTAATPKAVSDALAAAKTYADGKVTGLYNYKGSVATYANLPASPATGDVYNVEAAYGDYPAGTNWAWTGTAWDALGGSFTITFATAAEVTAVLEA